MGKFADRLRMVYDREARRTFIEMDGTRVGTVMAVKPEDFCYTSRADYAILLKAEVNANGMNVKAFTWDVRKMIETLAKRMMRVKAHLPAPTLEI